LEQRSSPVLDFAISPWLKNAHAQTILATLFGPKPENDASHRVALPDGDCLYLHERRPATWKPGDRAVLLVHGLAGDHSSPYVVRLARTLAERGVLALSLDLRGSGVAQSQCQRTPHAGVSADLRAAVERAFELFPESRMTLIGFSLGANIALKLCAELGQDALARLDSVAAVCPPVDLERSVRALNSGLRFYEKIFIPELNQRVAEMQRHSHELRQVSMSRPPQTVRDFDERVTARLWGYRDARDYYESCSSGPMLSKIARPTLIIAADDDPIVPKDSFLGLQPSTQVNLIMTRGGGHLGFLARGSQRRWLDARLCHFVESFPAP
jgi:predicted alpha/beta-fold hydrolase